MNVLKKLGQNFKKVAAVAITASLLVGIIAPISAKAESPKFNFLDGDYKLIRGANKSAGETDWHAPVNGVAGDTFAGIIYYHNGIVDTTAHNTKVKVSLPAQSSGNKIVIGATLSADNAPTISDTLTVNLNKDANVSLIPGSVQWFPNFNSVNNPPANLLYNQTGNEIISGNGLNLGDINGCWQYIGYVIFQFRTDELPAPNIVKNKIAKNLTTGAEGTDVFANPGDEVLYTLTTRNTGNQNINYIVDDNIADILEYADFLDSSMGGNLNNGVISYPPSNINANDSIIRTFRVKVKNPLPTNQQSGKRFDMVLENIYGNIVFVRLSKSKITIQKLVRNVTSGEVNFVDQNTAKPGDTLEYKVIVTNGTAAGAMTLTDQLPANVSYVSGSTILNRNSVDTKLGDGITSDSISLGNINAGESFSVIFRAKISSSIANAEVLINTATVHFNKEELSDTAKTTIKIGVTGGKLPMTGAETWIVSILIAAAFAIGWKYRKKLVNKFASKQ